MRAIPLAMLLFTAPTIAWECRDGLWVQEYNEFGDLVNHPAPVVSHFELASDVLFGQPVRAWLEDGGVFVNFKIFEALKGEKSGEIILEMERGIDPKIIVGRNYVISLFDGGLLDLCSMVVPMPLYVDSRVRLINHAQRDDYHKDNARLRELLRITDVSP